MANGPLASVRGFPIPSVVCQEFRSVGSVRERPGGHLRMRVSPKWGLRGVGRVGKTVII